LLVGTTADNGYKLQISTNSAAIDVQGFYSIGNPIDILRTRYSGSSGCEIIFRGYNPNNGSDADLAIILDDTGGNNNTLMYFDGSSQSVGIGTTAPASLLHISGSGNTFTRYTNTTSTGHYIDIGANSAGQSFVYGYGAYPLLFATNGSEAMRITSGGNVGIGITAPLQKVHVVGAVVGGNTATTGLPNTSGVTTQLAFEARSTQAGNDPSIAYHKEAVYTMYLQSQNSPRGLRLYSPSNETTANFYVQGDVVAFSSSDRRLKDNLSPITNALDKVSKLTGYEFDWNENQSAYTGHDYGVVAQEVEEVLPELVQTREDGYKAVKYDKLVSVLIEAIKEQQKQIDELKSKLK
jgi:hypothetical protein